MGNFKLLLPLQNSKYKFSHAKFYMFDQNKIIITSANFSKNGISDSGQYETGVLIELADNKMCDGGEFIETLNNCIVIEQPQKLKEEILTKRDEIKQKNEHIFKFSKTDKEDIKEVIFKNLSELCGKK
jgi:phosphatidylserine/phosphatidylglycerophosphate/cardiolipin synthase-like enzyme